MTAAADLRSGKGHRDENFPVASVLISPQHRAPILAFYEFVRTADDIADHPTLSSADKLAHLDALEADLLGRERRQRRRAAPARRARGAKDVAAPRPGSPGRVSHGRHQAALSRLGRTDRLLQPVGDAGRPVRARRPWRAALDLGGERRAVRGLADQQSPPGLSRRLLQPRSRLCPAGCARRRRRPRRGARRGAVLAGTAALPAGARAPHRGAARGERGLCGIDLRFSPVAGGGGDHRDGAAHRRPAREPRSPERERASDQDRHDAGGACRRGGGHRCPGCGAADLRAGVSRGA